MHDFRIGYMIAPEHAEVKDLAKLSGFGMSDDDFEHFLKATNVVFMTATAYADDLQCRKVLGYIIYYLEKNKLNILQLAVNPYVQRLGIATAVLETILVKMHMPGCKQNEINYCVREVDLATLNFLKAFGFVSTEVVKDSFRSEHDDLCDGINMRFVLGWKTRTDEKREKQELELHAS